MNVTIPNYLGIDINKEMARLIKRETSKSKKPDDFVGEWPKKFPELKMYVCYGSCFKEYPGSIAYLTCTCPDGLITHYPGCLWNTLISYDKMMEIIKERSKISGKFRFFEGNFDIKITNN